MSYSKSYEPIPQLTGEENKLLELKYKSCPLDKINDSDLLYQASLLILKIHVIAGWNVPEKELKNILVDQFTKKIKERYTNVNAEEIDYAFRHNTTVKDWGKSINLVLIDEVLGEYLEKRSQVSQLEEKYKNKELPPPVKEEDVLSDEDYISANKAVYRLTGNAGLVSVRCFNILLKNGCIKRAEGKERERITKISRSNFFAIENRENIKNISHEEQERLIEQDCKRVMICEYFNSIK